jgi:DNA ligase (NAD+)
MSDGTYDALWRRHLEARRTNPTAPEWKDTILDKVGSAPRPASGFKKVKHLSPMMSLDNIFVQTEGDPASELIKWLSKIETGHLTVIVVEPKIDGLSASVIYEDGLLSRVVTRGDGTEGVDITDNALAAALVPATIVPDAAWGNIHVRGIREFRGEIYMPFSAFEVLCEMARMAGEDPPSNPRNAAAGMIMRKDSSSLVGCGLKFLVHGIENPQHESYLDDKAAIANYGFSTPAQLFFTLGHQIDTHMYESFRKLAVRQYPTDGLVFKLADYDLRKQLGSTSRAPRWAIALKLEQEQVETICSDITVQVGRSGILTPVAELVPVTVDGSVVSRATLHNESQVNRLGLAVGDTVVLQKAGGVIPEIVASLTFRELCRPLVLKAGRSVGKSTSTSPAQRAVIEVAKSREFNLLAHINHQCPECGSKDVEADGQRYVCRNTVGCKAQMAARVEHMASRGCLNIMGLGTEACDAIAQLGEINHPFDILDKPVEWFANLAWVTDTGKNMTFGKARATKVVESCRNIGKQPLNRWITALGIHSIGENTGKEISRLFSSARQLMALRKRFREDIAVDAICRIAAGEDKKSDMLLLTKCSNHLGPVSCKALIDFVDSDAGHALLERIQEFGAESDNHNPIPMQDEDAPAGALTGKTFAITGTLSQPRDYFKALIQDAGGKVTDTISAKLTALVCGEGGGGKRDKAAKLGIPVWDEAQLMKEVAV